MSQPNILLIISDDHGYGDLSLQEVNADVNTPNLDRLAAEGMFFNQGYVSAPICSPSRSGLITGAYQNRWGVEWFDSASFAPENFATMPEVLSDAGYRTGYFGKVHYGASDDYGQPSCPDQHGFDESFYGLAQLSMGRLHYLHHGADRVAEYGEAAEAMGVQPMVENGTQVDCENHLTVEFADRAMNFMNPADDPFFCMVAFNAVHNFTWQLPDYELDERGLPQHPDFDAETSEYLDWYDGAVNPNLENGREYYLAQLEIMDREIGRLLDHLEATGQRENTLVVYLTDNGGSMCNYGNNTPLMGGKYTLFEGGVRVPYIISWPSQVQAGTTSDALVSSLDLMRTFADVAGVELPDNSPNDGISLLPVLRGETDEGHDYLFFDNGFQWSVRSPEWKLRWVDDSSPVRKYLRDVEHTDIGEGYSLVPMAGSTDESPTANVLDEHPEVAEKLQQARERWLASLTATPSQ